ncbi:MAG TPA: hypothetical protein VH088_01555 [Terriglobales bacterium]|jgi:hypothetical protein|nr:hypothetical protein [Terriglobales bacterium]
MQTLTCSICGDASAPTGRWFLVAENSWEDKLKILEWNERLASHNGVHQACSVGHVQQLVVHWMTTGSLDYPFAQLLKVGRTSARNDSHGIRELEFDARPIGELTVHRESMQRVLSESPHSLKTILDALLAALRRESPEMPGDPELENGDLQTSSWEV